MLTEIRQIIFPQDDLVRALISLRRKRGTPMGAGSVVKVDIHSGKAHDVSITLKVAHDDRTGTTDYVFAKEEIASGLIMFCIDERVPMPVKATKSVHLVGGSVALVLTINLRSGELDNVAL